ncbi:MAG: Coq4 family protein [Cyanobacteria bacterium]|nr:Coq4 family protein [Cyanobacteriota bacterium]
MNTSSLSSLEKMQAQRVECFLHVFGWVTDRLDLNVPPIVKMDYLRSLPPGTLGHAWAEHLDANGLQPFVQGPRRQQLHDGIHVLTGYGTDPVGEAEVQAFLLGSKFRLVNMLIGLGLLRGIQRQRQHQILTLNHAAVRSRLQAAYQRGQHSRFAPDTWQPEELWERSLVKVQTDFGI